MSYYEHNTPPSWPTTRSGWERSAGTTNFSRPHTSTPPDLTIRYTTAMKPEEPIAFGSQLDEVDRAVDNLVKSGKMFATPRRDSMPVLGPRTFTAEHVDPRMVPQLPGRHYSLQDLDTMRTPPAANLQTYLASQRFQPRASPETEQMLQAKRRLAAQRERELRNYHQEQQFNRTILAEMSSYGKDRIVSPGAMTEDERRELIARQHRALYGTQLDDGVPVDENGNPRQINALANGSANAANITAIRGASPMTFDPFGLQSQGVNGKLEGASVQTPTGEHQAAATTSNSPARSRTNSASSPSSKSASFSLFENNPQAQSSRTSASSPGGSPPRSQGSRLPSNSINGVAPIGTRPSSQAQATNPALTNKRSTTPLPSPLSYGFGNNEDPFQAPKERSASAASNNSSSNPQDWGKVWGAKGLGSVASVWG